MKSIFKMNLATVFAGLAFVVILVVYWLRGRKNPSKPRICILVLGDIGRSPRMQYHALSCTKAGYYVDLVGFGGMRYDIGHSKQSTIFG